MSVLDYATERLDKSTELDDLRYWSAYRKGAADQYAEDHTFIPPIYDQEQIIYNCNVQILTNSETGECDIGWIRTVDTIEGDISD